ncbi:hypothetical protein DRQ33_02800 [bacterium]|nr:MAG: hypothetical protein DRQ33_02800 [bacterium]
MSDVGGYEAAYFGNTASGNAIKTGGDGKCGNIWVASDNVVISAGQLNATSTVAGTPAIYATNSAGGNAIQSAGNMWFSSGNLYTENNWTLYSKSSGSVEQNVFTPINGDDNTIFRIGPGNNLYIQDNSAGNIAQFADGENALFLWGNVWLRNNRIVYDGIADDNQTYIGFVEPTSNDNVINFPDGSGTVSLLGQTIESSEITDGTITTVDIEASPSDAVLVSDGTVQWSVATDGKYLKYTTAGGFEWADAGGAGSADYDWNNRYGGEPENSDSVYHTGLVTVGAVADPLRSNTKLHVKNGNIELADNWGIIFYDASSKIHAVSPDLFISSAHDLYISSDGDDKIDMCSGLLVINNSVNKVGINATSIDYDLDVDGDIGIGDEISPSNDRLIHNGDDDTYFCFDSDAILIYAGSECLVDITEAGQDYVKIGDGGDVDINLNDDVFVRGSDGNVGIGTAAPGQLLDIRDDVYIGAYSTSDGESEFLRINAENEEWYVGVRNLTAPNSRFFIGLDQTDNKFAIDPGGNVGIGTVLPAEKLDVDGAIKLGTTAGTNTGTIRWDGSNFQGYDGSDWVNLDESTGATELNDLTDVTITGAATGDILYYNGTGWVNLVKGSDGQALVSTSTSIEWGSAGDNLGNHVATQDLRPDATGTHDLGTATYKWDNLYVGTVHADQVDPIVQINGKQYVTWMAEAIGMWIETIGVGRLSGSAYKVDIAAQPEGSDLWLFYNVVAESTIVPFVTPQDDAYLIARMEGSVLIVKALSGDGEARFSFRLAGKRRDWATKPTEKVNTPKQRIDTPVNMDFYDKNGNIK